MTITVEIRPEVQAELARQAAARGHGLEAYATRLLEQAAHAAAETLQFTPKRLETTLLEMAQFSHKIPSLPDEAFTRESLYQDHD